MTTTKLRAVGADEKAPSPRSMTVLDAAKDGTELELLIAMRDRIATAVSSPNCPARELAALTKRLMEVVKDIDAHKARAREEAVEGDAAADGEWDSEAI